MGEITRRDFLDGVAIGIGALALGCGGKSEQPQPEPPFAPEKDPYYYPPQRVGMRGSHPGSFEVAHDLRDGTLAVTPQATGEQFDLIVVGGGISGLSAAHYWRKAKGEGQKILILDNHDDFGGHAKRNEFRIGFATLVSYGGTESIEYPSAYSAVARKLLDDIGIDIDAFHKREQFGRKSHDLRGATFFDRRSFGTDRLVKAELGELIDGTGKLADAVRSAFADAPLSPAIYAAVDKLRAATDYWPKQTSGDQKAKLAAMSYRAFLLDVVGLPVEALALLQTATHSLYGVGIDAVSALDCWALELPGFAGMRLKAVGEEPSPGLGKTPILEQHSDPGVQFVDGNATVARLLVRRLVDGALPGRTMFDATEARLDYAKLDGGPTSIRLNSTVVRVKPDGEVVYVRGGKAYSVRGGACVLACWNGVIPHLVHELPAAQKLALAYGVKVPLVYTNVALRNWRAWKQLGIGAIEMPGSYFTSARLELDRKDITPDEPAVVKLVRTPCHPGLPAREQHRMGRTELLTTRFKTFETEVESLFSRMFAGFDTGDIAGITVNRWPHGYAYEYNSLWDKFAPGQEPCVIGRAKLGQIAIANSDAGAYAYTDCAIEQAKRAVDELV